MGLITLREVAQDACIEDGDMQLNYPERNMTFCQRAYGDLYLYQFPNVKTILLEISDVLTCRLPNDYVQWTKVGLMDTCTGRIVVLGYDATLCTAHKNVCPCDRESCEREINELFAYNDSQRADQFMFVNPIFTNGTVYGLGGGYNRFGFFKENREDWELQFSGKINYGERMKLVMEYKADGTTGGVNLVPSEAKEAIINFCLSKVNKKRDRGLSNEYKRDWQVEYKRLQSLYRGMSKEQWSDLFKRHAVQTVSSY